MGDSEKATNPYKNLSLSSIKNRLRERKRKLKELDELISVLTEKLETNDNLMNRTNLTLAQAERINLNADIFLLELEEDRIKKIYDSMVRRDSFEDDQPQPC